MATSTYIDLTTLAAPTFSPHTHANALVLATNNPSDPIMDLTTPLSKALFDLQEINSHIDTLTSRSAIDILSYTATQNEAAQRILDRVEDERARLNGSFQRLEREVLGRYERALAAQTGAERSWHVLNLGRAVQRVLGLARQFETVLAESALGAGGSRLGREDHKALLQACYTLTSFREIMDRKESVDLGRVNLVKTVRGRIFEDGEARILDFARKVVREFAISNLVGSASISSPTFREAEDNRARFTSAVHILYLLSPAPAHDGEKMKKDQFVPQHLLRALQSYLQTAITSSSASMGRALGQLPTLEKTLLEVSARCQNVVALELLLKGIQSPKHPLLQQERRRSGRTARPANGEGDDEIAAARGAGGEEEEEEEGEEGEEESRDNLLNLLLRALDTPSLPSYFWRSLASSMSARLQEILNRGGVVARTLRSQRDHVRNEIRECVLRGSRLPQSVVANESRTDQGEIVRNWEREAAVMVGSVVGPLGR